MSKPFNIQSPEQIAKEYAGNKQKIAEAMQMGMVDPTAGVLAGMFIDRMRAAQMQEAAPQSTVAQQVMGGAAPTLVPPQSAAGVAGLVPQAAPPMAPMQAPMEAPMEAPMGEAPPMGMAEGGLTSLPIPEDMFDEPTNGGFNDGYAGGGLVAFGDGGEVPSFRGGGMSDLYDDVEYWESRGRQSAVSPKGARGVMQLMPGTMRDPGFGIRPMQADTEEENRRVGREYLDAMFRRYGDKQLALMAYNWGPGSVDKWIKAGRPADKVPGETRKYVSNILGGKTGTAKSTSGALPERDTDTAEGRARSFDDQVAVAERVMSKLPDSGLGALQDYYKKELSPEEKEKNRKYDMWATLAQVGAGMASGKSPNFLTNVGEAIAGALPGLAASKKERRQAERDANRGMAEVLGLKRAERKEVLDFAKELHRTEMAAEAAQTEREFRSSEAATERDWRSDEAAKDRAARLDEAAAKEKGFDALVTANYDKLKAEAEKGVWKTPMGNKPSEAIIRYWAQQHAIEQWAKRSGSNQNPILPGVPPTGNTGVDLTGWGKPSVVAQ